MPSFKNDIKDIVNWRRKRRKVDPTTINSKKERLTKSIPVIIILKLLWDLKVLQIWFNFGPNLIGFEETRPVNTSQKLSRYAHRHFGFLEPWHHVNHSVFFFHNILKYPIDNDYIMTWHDNDLSSYNTILY